jgi:hypothetical protein
VDEPKAIFFDLAGDFFRKGKAVFFTRRRFGWQAHEMKSGADPNRETYGKSILQAHPAGRVGRQWAVWCRFFTPARQSLSLRGSAQAHTSAHSALSQHASILHAG